MGQSESQCMSRTPCTLEFCRESSLCGWNFQIRPCDAHLTQEHPSKRGVFENRTEGKQCHKGLFAFFLPLTAALLMRFCQAGKTKSCGRQRERVCRSRLYEVQVLRGIRTRSGTCRTRRDQWNSGRPAGCSSRQRSCCRCQIQDQGRPAR